MIATLLTGILLINSIGLCGPFQIPDQSQKEYGDTGWLVNEKLQVAQSFKPAKSTLSMVSLYISKQGDPQQGITLSIKDNLNAENLTQASIDFNWGSKTYSWIKFDFEDIAVTPGNTYYIIASADECDENNCYGWICAEDENAYPDGNMYQSMDRGLTWTPPKLPNRGRDCCFITYAPLSKSSQNTLSNQVDSNVVSTQTVENERSIPQYNRDMLLDDELDQEQSDPCGWGHGVSGAYKLAQSFTPSLSTLTRIELLVFKKGNIGCAITIEIKDNLDGNILATESFSDNIINNESLSQWVEIDITDVELINGEKYYISWSQTGGAANNYIYWLYGNDNPYQDGESWIKLGSWQRFETDQHKDVDFCFRTYGIPNEPPQKPLQPSGPTNVKRGTVYSYETNAFDPNDDQLYYLWDWGDGSDSGWLGPYDNGNVCEQEKSWTNKGTYDIKVKAKDQFDQESEWSDPLSVSIPKTKIPSFMQIIERYFQYVLQFTQIMK